MAGKVIFRYPTEKQPTTVSDKPVAGAYLPGTFVEETASQLVQVTAHTAAAGKLPLLLTNRDWYGQDVLTAYASGDTGAAYELEPGYIVQAALAAGTYTNNQPLTIGAAGRLVAAVAANVVVAHFVDTPGAYTAGQLADVQIANSYNAA